MKDKITREIIENTIHVDTDRSPGEADSEPRWNEERWPGMNGWQGRTILVFRTHQFTDLVIVLNKCLFLKEKLNDGS